MKLAMIPEEQRRWMGQWRQIRAPGSVPNVWGNLESEREQTELRVFIQKLRPKSRF
jgi:hypothetical protein